MRVPFPSLDNFPSLVNIFGFIILALIVYFSVSAQLTGKEVIFEKKQIVTTTRCLDGLKFAVAESSKGVSIVQIMPPSVCEN